MNNLKLVRVNYSGSIFIGMMLIPLLFLFLLHYKVGTVMPPDKARQEPTVEVSAGLASLLLKI